MKKLFEPITTDQIQKIFSRAREIRLSEDKLYGMIEQLIGIPSTSALSKPEAVNIIERLMGPTKWVTPLPARTEEQIEGDSAHLPLLAHIVGIRLMVKELGWDKDHLKNWLHKYVKVKSIRQLNRKRAHDAFVGLKCVQEHAHKKRRGKVTAR